MNRSQQALCMFRVFYDHAKDSESMYYAWVSYLLQTPGYWTGVTGGLRYFDDQNMLKLLEDTKQLIEARCNKRHVPLEMASVQDLEQDHELFLGMKHLYERFNEIAPDSLKRISMFIRSNPQDFVVLKEE
ncbi:hypothetical protein ABEW68_11320 [Paenibacillus lautus]|uniref:hypothetical protein n=2 Tax=Paenibacillus lautus TaxID=1401 RepID=UPI003D2A8E16